MHAATISFTELQIQLLYLRVATIWGVASIQVNIAYANVDNLLDHDLGHSYCVLITIPAHLMDTQ